MKSAYELAMERLAQTDPVQSLSAEQKQEIAELESKFKAKRAEREIFLEKQLKDAKNKGHREEVAEIEKQLRSERKMLEEDLEIAKEKVRNRS